MGLFNRKPNRVDTNGSGDVDGDSTAKKEKGGWRRPANTAFKQQRLKAWQPILTPKTVLPTLFLIGILFAPIGGLLIWGSSMVSEITFDYTDCDLLSPSTSQSQLTFTNLPKYSYRMEAKYANLPLASNPQYAFVNSSNPNVSAGKQCFIRFDVPANLKHTVLMYYKLTNFFQNHRRYVKSLNTDQLKGKYVSPSDLQQGDCKPLATNNNRADGTAIYPCGLIANSIFNDTFSNLTLLTPVDNVTGYNFSYNGIAWPGEAKKYAAQPSYNFSEIVPPPNWFRRYGDSYNDTNPPPDLKADEHFQNWMRTAGLPTFTKLYGRNDQDDLVQGTYQIVVDLNYPVRDYQGTKSIVISTVSWIGGKNPFLGWAYVAAAGVFILLAIAGTIRQHVKHRRLGDLDLLSWNRGT